MTTASPIERYRARVRTGAAVLGALVVLSLVEYIAALAVARPLLVLGPIAIAKGWLIMQFFMHAGDLRAGDEH